MTSNSIASEKELYAEMASRLTDDDLKDIASYDYFEEREKNLTALKTFQKHLYVGTGFNIHPRRALEEYSWVKFPKEKTRHHEKRIFAACMLTLNYCADVEQWLGFDTTAGQLLQSIIYVNPNLLKKAKPLFTYAESRLDDEEHVIFAKLGSFICLLSAGDIDSVKVKLFEIERMERDIIKSNRRRPTHPAAEFAKLKPPLMLGGWHTSRMFIRQLNENITDEALKTDITALCDRLWMPKAHYFWKWDERPRS